MSVLQDIPISFEEFLKQSGLAKKQREDMRQICARKLAKDIKDIYQN